MSNRCTIAIRVPRIDGFHWMAIYCHNHGSPDRVGRILSGHYRDESKVMDLIGLGPISVLAEEIGEPQVFDHETPRRLHPRWCLAYGRDRGERNAVPEMHHSWRDLARMARDNDSEYLYVYHGGSWRVVQVTDNRVRARLVAEDSLAPIGPEEER